MINKIRLLIVFLATTYSGFSQDEVEIILPSKNENQSEEKIYSNYRVDNPATFKDSVESIFNFYREVSNYEINNIKNDEQTTYFNIFIDERGCAYSVKIIKSIGLKFDNEVREIVKKMPLWSPAIHNEKKVKVSVVEYITFK